MARNTGSSRRWQDACVMAPAGLVRRRVSAAGIGKSRCVELSRSPEGGIAAGSFRRVSKGWPTYGTQGPSRPRRSSGSSNSRCRPRAWTTRLLGREVGLTSGCEPAACPPHPHLQSESGQSHRCRGTVPQPAGDRALRRHVHPWRSNGRHRSPCGPGAVRHTARLARRHGVVDLFAALEVAPVRSPIVSATPIPRRTSCVIGRSLIRPGSTSFSTSPTIRRLRPTNHE